MNTVIYILRSRTTKLGLASLWIMPTTRKWVSRVGLSLLLLLPLVVVVDVMAGKAKEKKLLESENSLFNARAVSSLRPAALPPLSGASTIYNNIPGPLPPNVASLGYQANQTSEFGDLIQFAGTNRALTTVTLVMSDWALASTYNSMSPTWSQPITFNLYNVDNSGANPAPGTLIATQTHTFAIPWRPEADPTCPGGTAWRAGDGNCYNGLAFEITFDFTGTTVPGQIIYGVAFNTKTWGYQPIGQPGPYESLNFGLNDTAPPAVGTRPFPDTAYWNTATANNYTDGGAGGVGIFRRDTQWTPYSGAVSFEATTGCTITCPPDQTANTGPGAMDCCATVNYPDPTGPGCGEIACSPPSGSCYPVGATTVTCGTVQDGPSCTFTVTVTDTTPPVITCPMNQTLSANGNCQAVATYSATATDNCTASPTVMCMPQSGSTFPKGTTTVTCTATDLAGNTAMCTFTVTVNDTQPPSITCPANVTKINDPNQCGAVVTYPNPTGSDNCPNPTFNCSPASGSFFPVGTTTVTCTAKDAANNMASCTFTVTVQDTQPPSITCPGNITSTTASCPPASSGTVNFTVTASDNCPGVTVVCKNQNNQVVTSGSPFPVGTTTVSCTATDASGNTAACSFTVTVFNACLQDDSDPSIVVVFNSQTGEYRFCCGQTTYTGTGTVTIRGCIVGITHNAPDRRVQITFDGSVSRGSASLLIFSGNVRWTITDRNTTNNSCICP